MTSAFGGQHSIQLSYGCLPAPIKKRGPACKAGPDFPAKSAVYIQVATPPCPEQVPWRFL